MYYCIVCVETYNTYIMSIYSLWLIHNVLFMLKHVTLTLCQFIRYGWHTRHCSRSRHVTLTLCQFIRYDVVVMWNTIFSFVFLSVILATNHENLTTSSNPANNEWKLLKKNNVHNIIQGATNHHQWTRLVVSEVQCHHWRVVKPSLIQKTFIHYSHTIAGPRSGLMVKVFNDFIQFTQLTRLIMCFRFVLVSVFTKRVMVRCLMFVYN